MEPQNIPFKLKIPHESFSEKLFNHSLNLTGTHVPTPPSAQQISKRSCIALELNPKLFNYKAYLEIHPFILQCNKWPSVISNQSESHLYSSSHSSKRRDSGVSVATQLEEKEETITTIMIRNIPNKYTQAQFKAFLDTYIPNDYDFLYLRVDFQNKVSSSIN